MFFGFDSCFVAKESSQEVLRLRHLLAVRDQELAKSRSELERKLAEWKMRDKTGDQTGSTTLGGSDEPMDTTAALQKAADALLAPSACAGGSRGGGGEGQHQEMPPPPSV